MLFNPTDKHNSIIADIDFWLYGTSEVFNSSYSMEDRTRNINKALDQITFYLYKADPSWTWDDRNNSDFPIVTSDSATGDHVVVLDSTSVIHRVRISENGSFRTLEPVLRRQLTDTELDSNGNASKYYKLGNGIFPVPIPSGAYFIEIEFDRKANHFSPSDTSVQPGFDSQYHQYLSLFASHQYALANGMSDKVSMLEREIFKITEMIRDHFALRSPDQRPRLSFKKASLNSYGF